MITGKYFSKIIFQRKCVLFFSFYLFLIVSQKNAWGNGRSGIAVFRENLVAICTHEASVDMDISMDIHGKSVDMDMNMDGKFHIHGKPVDG